MLSESTMYYCIIPFPYSVRSSPPPYSREPRLANPDVRPDCEEDESYPADIAPECQLTG